MLGALVKRLFVLILVLALPSVAGAQVSIPVYGNWCGPDYPVNPAFSAPPIDAVDAACMRHDYCTAVRGRFDCGCDLALMNELRYTPWPNPYIQNDARSISDAIAVIPCSDPFGTAEKQSLFMQDVWNDTLNGNAAPLNVLDRWRQVLSNSLR